MKQNYLGLKTSFLLFSIYLCCFIFLTSCRNPVPPTPPNLIDQTHGVISENLVARIYFDATLSMQGFVVPSSTRYTQMCRYLESVIVSGWEIATVNFFRFGEQVEPIDRSTYLNLSRTGFYENSRIFRETFIQKIIEHEAQLTQDEVQESVTTEESTETTTIPEETNNNVEKSPLVIIVTDLFQDNRDLTVLVKQLKEQYIQKGYEVGILGLRSEFDGTVYDLGDAPLPYRSTPDNPETFRPFYLLVIGRHADIAHYFDRLIANGFTDAQTILFSRYLVSPLLSFEGSAITPDNLNDANYAPNDPLWLQYEIVRNSLPTKITVEGIKYDPLPHAMSFDANTFKEDIIAKHKPDRNGENEQSPDAERRLTVTPTFSENELTVEFDLTTSLTRRAVYLYEVTLHPKIDAYKVPDWCSDWDMGAERNGARTLNLVNFVRGLTETTAREHNPKIAQFCFYIKKR